MWDKTGDDRVDTTLFLTGVSPLASVLGVREKLAFAFDVFDVENVGTLTNGDLESILACELFCTILSLFLSLFLTLYSNPKNIRARFFFFKAINATSSYFGDAVITSEQIEIIVEDVFRSSSSSSSVDIKFADLSDDIVRHPLVVEFASGGGHDEVRYQITI